MQGLPPQGGVEGSMEQMCESMDKNRRFGDGGRKVIELTACSTEKRGNSGGGKRPRLKTNVRSEKKLVLMCFGSGFPLPSFVEQPMQRAGE